MKKIKLLILLFFLIMLTGCPSRNPYAEDDYISVLKNEKVMIHVLLNDVHLSYPDYYTLLIEKNPSFGRVDLNEDNSFTYTPNQDYVGTDTFTYQIYSVKDETEVTSHSATVTIKIKENNISPVATDDSYIVIKNESNYFSVLINDKDEDDEFLTIVSIEEPWYGKAITFDGLNIYYEPEAGYIGNDFFTYTISDGIEESTATVYILIKDNFTVEDNSKPIAVDDVVIVQKDQKQVLNLLFNDLDEDGSIYIQTMENPKHGIVYRVNGKEVYKPDKGFVGTDQFNYTIFDGYETSTATVYITIKE